MTPITLNTLRDHAAAADRLAAGGLDGPAADAKAALFARAAAALAQAGVAPAAALAAWFVPGRIEVLGKHTDYAGGRSMLVAPQRGICIAAAGADDQAIHITDAISGQSATFAFDADLRPPAGRWVNYPMTVARRLARNFPGPRRGVRIALASDLPRAAGLSSSSALVVATFLVMAQVNQIHRRDEYRRNIRDRVALAGYLATIENGRSFADLEGDAGVGTFGGSEDHTAILCARAGAIEQFAYSPVRHERTLAMPSDCCFVVAASGVVAEKTGAAMHKYNRLSAQAAAIVDLWRQATGRDEPTLAALLGPGDGASDGADDTRADEVQHILATHRHASFSSAQLIRRLEHFLCEDRQIIPTAGDCLAAGDLAGFAALAARSQQTGAALLENQTPETIFLAEQAVRQGAAAASAFGAGFGGSVWALVPTSDAERWADDWLRAYRAAFPIHAPRCRAFVTSAGPAAFSLGAHYFA